MPHAAKVDFVPLASLSVAAPPAKAGGKVKQVSTLIIFAGEDLNLGKATRSLLGEDGVALVKKAAGAAKFKGKAASTLDILAPAGLTAERLLVIGVGRRRERKIRQG